MIAATSSSSVSAAAQQGAQQLRALAAKRTAEQAVRTARTLQEQAAEAQQDADRAQEYANSLSLRSKQAQTNAGKAQQGLRAMEGSNQMQSRLAWAVAQTTTRQDFTPVKQADTAQAVVNADGQTTGTVINTAA